MFCNRAFSSVIHLEGDQMGYLIAFIASILVVAGLSVRYSVYFKTW